MRSNELSKSTLVLHEPFSWCLLSLARRAGFRQLLRSLSRREKMGLGSVLARGRIFFLDHLPMAAGKPSDPGPVGRSETAVLEHTFLDVFLWPHVGFRRADLWTDYAVSRH